MVSADILIAAVLLCGVGLDIVPRRWRGTTFGIMAVQAGEAQGAESISFRYRVAVWMVTLACAAGAFVAWQTGSKSCIAAIPVFAGSLIGPVWAWAQSKMISAEGRNVVSPPMPLIMRFRNAFLLWFQVTLRFAEFPAAVLVLATVYAGFLQACLISGSGVFEGIRWAEPLGALMLAESFFGNMKSSAVYKSWRLTGPQDRTQRVSHGIVVISVLFLLLSIVLCLSRIGGDSMRVVRETAAGIFAALWLGLSLWLLSIGSNPRLAAEVWPASVLYFSGRGAQFSDQQGTVTFRDSVLKVPTDWAGLATDITRLLVQLSIIAFVAASS